MNTPTLIQFPNGEEQALDEWKEAEGLGQSEPADEPDKFIRWEVERSLMKTIGDLTSTQP
jgi:hypothetical protein